MHRFDKRQLSAATPAFSYPVWARFQDVDAAGIAFFARIAIWFHDAYFAFLGERGCDMPRLIAGAPWMAPMVHSEADFLAPIHFGDRLLAQVVAAHLGDTELAVGFRLVRASGGEVVAVGQQAHVFVERRSFQRVPVAPEMRRAFACLAEPAAEVR
jgi:1,4-dihydroxy-2-naphthoyl-CoA hydrolase